MTETLSGEHRGRVGFIYRKNQSEIPGARKRARVRALMAHRTPISRDLVRIIREVSKSENAPLCDNLRVIEERQAREVEFYLRACALRLERGI